MTTESTHFRPLPDKKFYFTTPIYYVNGEPHIGHIFTTTLVETLASWYKNRGVDTIYTSGVDEHGIKVETTARSNGFEPQTWCDQTTNQFLSAFERFDIHPDAFIRTTSPEHISTAIQFWEVLAEKGFIYKGKYSGWYSKTEEAFIPDNQIKEYVVNGEKIVKNSADDSVLFWTSEENYMFRLSSMQEQVLKWLQENPDIITPSCYYNQVVQLVNSGLNDISVSRQNVKWGIPVPGDPSQTMYVWIDALSSYLTGCGWTKEKPNFWPCDVHTIGKDILKFHAIYWPAFLIAAGVPVYRRLLVHGWWTRNETKMSKSLGNALDPKVLCDFWGVEAVKYFFLSEATLVSDSNYSDEAMLGRYNNDLADVLGNLVMRAISPKLLTNLQVPEHGELKSEDQVLVDSVVELPVLVEKEMSDGKTRVALALIWARLRDINKYYTDSQPWKLNKSDPPRAGTVLYVILEAIRIVVSCLKAFMPQTAGTILDWLGVKDLVDPQLVFKFGTLKPGSQAKQPHPLFQKKVLPE